MSNARFPIIWLTGNSGAGKSTLSFALRDYYNEELLGEHPLARRVITLDGDEMRQTVSVDEGFSAEDRRKHNFRMARLARLLQQHGFLVIVAVIAPFQGVREELEALCNPLWVYVHRSHLDAPDRPYEPPESPAYIIDNDRLSIPEARKALYTFIEETIKTWKESEVAPDFVEKAAKVLV